MLCSHRHNINHVFSLGPLPFILWVKAFWGETQSPVPSVQTPKNLLYATLSLKCQPSCFSSQTLSFLCHPEINKKQIDVVSVPGTGLLQALQLWWWSLLFPGRLTWATDYLQVWAVYKGRPTALSISHSSHCCVPGSRFCCLSHPYVSDPRHQIINILKLSFFFLVYPFVLLPYEPGFVTHQWPGPQVNT